VSPHCSLSLSLSLSLPPAGRCPWPRTTAPAARTGRADRGTCIRGRACTSDQSPCSAREGYGGEGRGKGTVKWGRGEKDRVCVRLWRARTRPSHTPPRPPPQRTAWPYPPRPPSPIPPRSPSPIPHPPHVPPPPRPPASSPAPRCCSDHAPPTESTSPQPESTSPLQESTSPLSESMSPIPLYPSPCPPPVRSGRRPCC
jgi:hypothetical protein